MVIKFEATVKKWGNSVGIVIPKHIVDELDVKPDDIVDFDVKKSLKVKDVFGIIPEHMRKRDTQRIKDELRKGWFDDRADL